MSSLFFFKIKKTYFYRLPNKTIINRPNRQWQHTFNDYANLTILFCRFLVSRRLRRSDVKKTSLWWIDISWRRYSFQPQKKFSWVGLLPKIPFYEIWMSNEILSWKRYRNNWALAVLNSFLPKFGIFLKSGSQIFKGI